MFRASSVPKASIKFKICYIQYNCQNYEFLGPKVVLNLAPGLTEVESVELEGLIDLFIWNFG